jgi:steroid 5-alpha reductase family enzyme
MINIVFFNFITLILVFSLFWLIQIKTKNAGIIDPVWVASIGLSTSYLIYKLGVFDIRTLLLLILILVWSFRLTFFLFLRYVYEKKEDRRYSYYKKKWGRYASSKMLLMFWVQAIFATFFSFCFAASTFSSLYYLPTLILGIIISSVGIFFSYLADKQLQKFKANRTSESDFYKNGLWKYSRHPNYFFEWLFWLGLAVCAIPSIFFFFCVLAPIGMYYLLVKATGIYLSEGLSKMKYGKAFEEYCKKTNSFFLWFPKKK